MLKVMSFNLRTATVVDAHPWNKRLPVATELIGQYEPDVIGTQEGIPQQIQDLDHALPAYSWVGIGRESDGTGEMMAVFYRHDMFKVLDSGHFWLSDTPQVAGSKTWGNHYPRMATWVQFENKNNGHVFYFLNTHLDHEIEEARVLGVKLLANHINKWGKEHDVIVTGDFNCEIGTSAVYQILRDEAQLNDGIQDAEIIVHGEYGTFHDYAGGSEGEMIDWILYRGAMSSVKSERILLQKGGQYPSDHYPVMVKLG